MDRLSGADEPPRFGVWGPRRFEKGARMDGFVWETGWSRLGSAGIVGVGGRTPAFRERGAGRGRGDREGGTTRARMDWYCGRPPALLGRESGTERVWMGSFGKRGGGSGWICLSGEDECRRFGGPGAAPSRERGTSGMDGFVWETGLNWFGPADGSLEWGGRTPALRGSGATAGREKGVGGGWLVSFGKRG